MKKIAKLLVCLICVSSQLVAQETLPPIQLDRPDLTESPFLTPLHYIQVESGLLYEKIKNGESYFTTPTVLTKYGVTNTFELRLITEALTTSEGGRSQTGMSPIWVGFKSKLMKENHFWPEMSFIGHLALPNFATNNLKSKYIAPQFRFVMQHTLSSKVSLAYNLGMEWDGFTPLGKYIYTLTTGIALTNRIGCYFELFGDYDKVNKAAHNFDAGLTYLINNNSMLDVSSGVQLNQFAAYQFLSCGYSFRFNTRK